MNHTEEASTELQRALDSIRDLHRREIEAVETVVALLNRAKQVPSLAQGSPPRPQAPAAPTPRAKPGPKPKPNGRNVGGGRGRAPSVNTERFKDVVSELSQPFSPAEAVAAFLRRHPDEGEWMERINVSSILLRWRDKGLLSREGSGGIGHPGRYSRTKVWGQEETSPSERELAYRKLRSEMPQPATEEE